MYVAAVMLPTAAGTVPIGAPVDVSGWSPVALGAALAVGHLYARREGESYRAAPLACSCPVCAAPYRTWADVEQHGRYDHGWPGELVYEAVPAWVRVERELTVREVEAIGRGVCPVCTETPTEHHLCTRHPELRAPGGHAPAGYLDHTEAA